MGRVDIDFLSGPTRTGVFNAPSETLVLGKARLRREPGRPLVRPYLMNDERAPICPACGVTMVPAALSARKDPAGDWICLECEETEEPQ